MEQHLTLKKLHMADYPVVKNMKTTVEDDYVLHIYEDLTTSNEHAVYGLFEGETLVAIAGYSIFASHFAMLGRLRTNKDYLGQGYAAEVLKKVQEEARQIPGIKWIGANTNLSNLPARRAIEKSGMEPVTTIHSNIIRDKDKLQATKGNAWKKVDSREEKRQLLSDLKNNALGVFPYECYYPFPLKSHDLSDEYLDASAFYINHDQTRFVSIKEDQKRDWYAHVKYFWNDHFFQPGFFETLFEFQAVSNKNPAIWIDFSTEGFQAIPDKEAFEIADPWVLHGRWVNGIITG